MHYSFPIITLKFAEKIECRTAILSAVFTIREGGHVQCYKYLTCIRSQYQNKLRSKCQETERYHFFAQDRNL